MLDLKFGSQFKRDRRLCVKRGYDMDLLAAVVDTLRIPAPLPPKNRAQPDRELGGVSGMPYFPGLVADLPGGGERAAARPHRYTRRLVQLIGALQNYFGWMQEHGPDAPAFFMSG